MAAETLQQETELAALHYKCMPVTETLYLEVFIFALAVNQNTNYSKHHLIPWDF